ncbi:unnamed protein product, partial [Brenthis ino]
MDSLYARSEETFAKTLISNVQLDRLVLALSEVTKLVSSSKIPPSLQRCILIRALRILKSIENQKNLLDVGFARCIPHPFCKERGIMTLGELWEIPLEHEWLCNECGRPLYDIFETV